MDHAPAHNLRWPRLRRWLAAGLCASAPLVGMGCAGVDGPVTGSLPPPVSARPTPPPASTGAATSREDRGPIQRVDHVVATPSKSREVPITLDTVLRLAEQHNPRIALAREKLNESEMTIAQGSIWLPNTYAGIAYYRHEGGIQQFDGRLLHSSTGALYPGLNLQGELDLREATFQEVDSQRRIWQNKAELSKVNNEILLEAATTYVDLLTARRGEAIACELEKHELKILDRAERTARIEMSATALVEAIKANLSNRHQTIAKLRQSGNAASAKLVYLLGLPPGTCLLPMDLILAPIELVDTTPATCDLVARALTHGPGIREIEGILATIQMGLDKSNGAHNLLPSVLFNIFEGPFGAGPGATLAWDNRLDVGVQLRWNLTQLCQAEQQRMLARSKQTQAMLNFDDVRNKLAAGVAEAHDAILAGRKQIGLATGQIRHASESYRLSDRRLEEGLPNATSSEVVLAIRTMEQAHFNHLQAISAHNKAQVRLMILLGGDSHTAAGAKMGPPGPGVMPPTPAPAPDNDKPDEKDRKERKEPPLPPIPPVDAKKEAAIRTREPDVLPLIDDGLKGPRLSR